MWSPEQDRALLDVDAWLKDPGEQQVFRLFGYAGTGKTTLARHLAQGVSGTVLFGAYTGKAAHVLRTKGCVGASTIHSMIYHSSEKSKARLKELEQSLMELGQSLREDGATEEQIAEHQRIKDIQELIRQERKNVSRPSFTLNDASEVRNAKLVVIDECSMVDGRMADDLMSFGTPILVLGDPAQLPPVGGEGFFTAHKPDVMLTEIHRQARDNPIIWMATKARNQEPIGVGAYGDSAVIERANPDLALAADQILVGRNKTRFSSNQRVRTLLGIEQGFPVHGDRIVCLRNNHDLGLLNGAIWRVEGATEVGSDQILMSISPLDTEGDAIDVVAHSHYFFGRGDELEWWEKKDAEEFDYGYALTVHKSQGSQWNNVLLFDESWCFRNDKWKWLYTGLTRAAEKVTVVKV